MPMDNSSEEEEARFRDRTLRKARRGMQNPKEILWSSPVRRAVLTVGAVNLTAGTVMAQQANQAAGMLCDSGLGSLVALALGALVIYLVLMAAFNGTIAFKALGSSRSEKKREGRERLKGAGINFAGAFFPAIFGLALDTAGIGAFSCINWQGIVGMSVVVAPF